MNCKKTNVSADSLGSRPFSNDSLSYCVDVDILIGIHGNDDIANVGLRIHQNYSVSLAETFKKSKKNASTYVNDVLVESDLDVLPSGRF